MTIDWDSSLETGVAEVDADHRNLVRLVNDLDKMLSQGVDSTRFGSVIDTLIDYAENHFRLEEEMLAQLGYPDIADHAESHVGFAHQLGAMVAGCIIDPGPASIARLRDHLHTWLIDHILREDMRFAPFVRERLNQKP
ncbi:bacteriohemerythrin [Magnetospirillum molischianum]|uniref:Putative Bacteriohemerythrin n=1 Tax=Magnetospirillum molischianum DSM 120 TaxID=1150626 RepID=H8FPL3_MAGML|nr:bacteriohemerythrin [Magnetospirillum molischianum]CCG40301.1 putative Bacteriohemerythrin [Magnetospirillum molischianum DSM 120]